MRGATLSLWRGDRCPRNPEVPAAVLVGQNQLAVLVAEGVGKQLDPHVDVYGAVAPYLAMSYLYKRSNRAWRFLIKHHLVHAAWRPLVELTRLRHVRFRQQLAVRDASETLNRPAVGIVPAGV